MAHRRTAHSEEFRDAAQQIPTLIVEELKRSSASNPPPETSVKKTNTAAQVYQSPMHSRKWMFIGVVTCSITILGFWMLYISNLIQENKATMNPTKTFTNSEDTKLANLISTFSALEKGLKETLTSPNELKAMVADALIPLLTTSSTTSTSSTTPITVTTTPTTTP